MTQKNLQRKKINKLDFFKIKNFHSSKYTVFSWHIRSLAVITPNLTTRKMRNRLKINFSRSTRDLRPRGKLLPSKWRDREAHTENQNLLEQKLGVENSAGTSTGVGKPRT